MIQVTDLVVPTLGTFSARVLIHGDQYAGTWSGKDHGGQMYGHIARAAATPQSGDGNWPSWRGAAGTGEAPGGTPPTEWSEDKNVVWKTPLPGLGNSTPVVEPHLPHDRRRDRRGARRRRSRAAAVQPTPRARGGRGQNNGAPKNVYDFRVIAVDRASGEVVWDKSVARAVPHEGGHKTGSRASNSPVTDGRFLYAHLGSRGVHCLMLAASRSVAHRPAHAHAQSVRRGQLTCVSTTPSSTGSRRRPAPRSTPAQRGQVAQGPRRGHQLVDAGDR